MHTRAEAAESYREDTLAQGNFTATLRQLNNTLVIVVVAQDPFHPKPLPSQQPHLPHLGSLIINKNKDFAFIEQPD